MRDEDKEKIVQFQKAAKLLFIANLSVIDLDITRPWGFYLSVNESQAKEFIEKFYKGVSQDKLDTTLPLRPKLLGFAPGRRLSWQYHLRRAEVWRCIEGKFKLITSETDKEDSEQVIRTGQFVSMDQGTRHRSVGLKDWSLVAEIWRHTEPKNLSNEDDIIRLQDDYGRN